MHLFFQPSLLLYLAEYPISTDPCYDRSAMRIWVLRTRLRKEDKLSINGSGIMTSVIRAEQHGAELVAKCIQEAVQATPVCLGVCGREAGVTIA